MMNLEEEYERRLAAIDKQLRDPIRQRMIDEFLLKLSEEFKCDFKLVYDVYPESDHYEEMMDEGKIDVPRLPTMKLGAFLEHISNEDHDFNVFIDPMYLEKGLNAINNVLTTTVDNNVLIIPVSHKK